MEVISAIIAGAAALAVVSFTQFLKNRSERKRILQEAKERSILLLQESQTEERSQYLDLMVALREWTRFETEVMELFASRERSMAGGSIAPQVVRELMHPTMTWNQSTYKDVAYAIGRRFPKVWTEYIEYEKIRNEFIEQIKVGEESGLIRGMNGFRPLRTLYDEGFRARVALVAALNMGAQSMGYKFALNVNGLLSVQIGSPRLIARRQEAE